MAEKPAPLVVDEVADAHAKAQANGERASPSHITLERFNTPTRNILSKFDDNGDGRIDATEIQAVVSTLVAEKFKSKAFKIGLIILAVFTVILLGAMFGLTWAVVAALKDTEVQGTTLVDKSTGVTLQVANVDMTLDANGQMVSRGSNGIVATAAYQGAINIDANTAFQALMKLTALRLQNPSNGAEVMVSVLGVARVPSNVTARGWAIKIHTSSGLVIVEDTVSVVGSSNDLLVDAGLVPKNATTGRHLLQSGGVTGTTSGATTTQAAYDSCSSSTKGPLANCWELAKLCYGTSPTSSQLSAFSNSNYACKSGSCPGNWAADGNGYCAYGYGATILTQTVCCS